MKDIRSIHLRTLQGRLGDIAYQLTRVTYSSFPAQRNWSPAINAYRCRDRIVICVDLAGVAPSQLDLVVEPRRVLISGHREVAEPEACDIPPLQILALEIDHGSFEREIVLPLEVVAERVQAEQRNGLLWINLPLKSARKNA